MDSRHLVARAHHPERWAIALQTTNAGILVGLALAGFARQIEFGLATRHQEVDVRQDLRIEQGTVQGTVRVVDAVAIAQHVQVIALAREEIPRHRQGIRDAADIRRLEVQTELAELIVHEAHVKGGVVGDELGAANELDEIVRYLAKRGLVRQEGIRDAVHGDSLGVHQPIRLDVDVEMVAGEFAVDHLHTADLDDAVPKIDRAARGVHAGGFGIQNDLAIQLGCAHDQIHVKLRFYSLVYPKPLAKTD